ncbi:hypothetical protein M9458_043522, partial [Cirrhinus mrigala]
MDAQVANHCSIKSAAKPSNPQNNAAECRMENAPKKKSRTRRGRRGKRRRGKKANEPPPFLPPE